MAAEVRFKYVEDVSGTRFLASEVFNARAALPAEEFKTSVLTEFGAEQKIEENHETTASAPTEEGK